MYVHGFRLIGRGLWLGLLRKILGFGVGRVLV